MTRTEHLWGPLLAAPFFQDLLKRTQAGERRLCLSGLAGGARALVAGQLVAAAGRPALLVLPDDAGLEAFRRDLSALAQLSGQDPRRIVMMPALDADPYAGIPPHPEVLRERVVALTQLAHGEVDLLLVPARALLQLLPSPEEWEAWTWKIRTGSTLPPEDFVLQAMGLGYRRVDTVSAPGEVSRRGGIVDVFPPTAHEPVRVELFGNTVDSMRSFDTDNQRSTGALEELVVGPAVENPPTGETVRRIMRRLESSRKDKDDDERTVKHLRARLEQLKEQGYFAGLEALAGLGAERPTLLFEHAKSLLLIVDEPERSEAELLRAAHELSQTYEQGESRALPPPAEVFADAGRIRDRLRDASLAMHELVGEEWDSDDGGRYAVECPSARAYAGRLEELAHDLRNVRKRLMRTICVMRAQGGADRLIEIFREHDLAASHTDAGLPPGAKGWPPGGLFVGVGGLRAGFSFPNLGLQLLSERDIFGEERKTATRKSQKHAAFIADFRDLKQGDYVVHVDHGIAMYAGMGRPRGGSLNRDFMVLEFAAGDRLFVPTDRLDLVQRYSGVAGRKASLDRLGGPGWERVKARVRKSVQSMAKELLELYARRATARGHAFSPDGAWQQELEAGFPFELTVDQQRVLGEVKEEMESRRVMDRLLVGDVGFGKTEIAVRAAFKAVNDGKQVALLTPTTVLAVQHFETFKERFAPFPVKVAMVSRFRTAGQIKETLRDVENGSVDVLIGTHRMLSKDVKFRQLGLLLVDEEQRFGVAHKERLKQISVGVDVLSMTATPIPRTLQMSLVGVRDLSVIETPPPGRMAIQTYLVPFRTGVIAQAIRQELRRDGQVFVVHNRVQTLPALAGAVREMVPDARVVVAHGQMNERQLEKVMLKFVHAEADVLVTTTIIENGLDIPRANTMIVNRADRLGLAQLYQLRGRVGRSQQHAYAYFLIPDRHSLSSEARRRLKALQDFSELGAGFRLAAADLEIRGAGEMLGSKQHGHIAALGFDMYCQILEQAVSELKGEEVAERRPPSVHLGVDIKLPQSYLPEAGDRLALYKRLAQAVLPSEVDRLQADTEDRFGHLPPAGQRLFDMSRLRLLAETTGVKAIDIVEDRLQLRFHEDAPVDPDRLIEILTSEQGSMSPSGALRLPAPPRGADRVACAAEALRRIIGESVL